MSIAASYRGRLVGSVPRLGAEYRKPPALRTAREAPVLITASIIQVGYTCRRCEIALRLKSFRAKIRRLLRDMEFDVGGPEAENKKEAETPRMDQR
jgi:hypothetical protein